MMPSRLALISACSRLLSAAIAWYRLALSSIRATASASDSANCTSAWPKASIRSLSRFNTPSTRSPRRSGTANSLRVDMASL